MLSIGLVFFLFGLFFGSFRLAYVVYGLVFHLAYVVYWLCSLVFKMVFIGLDFLC